MGFGDEEPNYVQEAQRQGIEPKFLEFNSHLPIELHEDWISVLEKENRDMMRKVSDSYFIMFRPKTVIYIMTICLRLRLPQDVKYLALRIFNDFMVAQIKNLWDHVFMLNAPEKEKFQQWKKVYTTLIRQIPLRAVSCIQLASKISSHNTLSITLVGRCLRSLGLAYTHEALRNSELRILYSLDYHPKMRHTQYAYLESVYGTLILKVRHFFDLEIDVGLIWDHCLVLLDCVLIMLDSVYRTLFTLKFGEEIQPTWFIQHFFTNYLKTRIQLVYFQSDYLLLVCGVIVLASFNTYGIQLIQNIISPLSRLTGISEEDIKLMNQGICSTILSYEPRGSSAHYPFSQKCYPCS